MLSHTYHHNWHLLCSPDYQTYSVVANASGERTKEVIKQVTFTDGFWSKPYYDCGGGNIWMMTYTVPFFGFENGTYFFK